MYKVYMYTCSTAGRQNCMYLVNVPTQSNTRTCVWYMFQCALIHGHICGTCSNAIWHKYMSLNHVPLLGDTKTCYMTKFCKMFAKFWKKSNKKISPNTKLVGLRKCENEHFCGQHRIPWVFRNNPEFLFKKIVCTLIIMQYCIQKWP